MLRWFWPRAESMIYAEAKRLWTEGLIQGPTGTGSRRIAAAARSTP
jgi:hypothetical protein